MIKNKWHLLAGIGFFLSGILQFVSNNHGLGLMFLLIGLANCWLATVEPPVAEKINDESIITNDPKFIELMSQGKSFKAMKQVRVLTSCSLDDAKAFVEKIEGKS